MKKYTVTLTYDVTISKVVTVRAATAERAQEIARDRVICRNVKDHYELNTGNPDGIYVELDQ